MTNSFPMKGKIDMANSKVSKVVLSCELVRGPKWSPQGLMSRAAKALSIASKTGKTGLIDVKFTTAYGQDTVTTFWVYEAKA